MESRHASEKLNLRFSLKDDPLTTRNFNALSVPPNSQILEERGTHLSQGRIAINMA